MAKVIGQDIPNQYYDQYRAVLTPAHDNKTMEGGSQVRDKQVKIPSKPPSVAQLMVRKAFKDSCDCWWLQKMATEYYPGEGLPRPYWWWKWEGEGKGMYPFHAFMSSTIHPYYRHLMIPWCPSDRIQDTYIWTDEPDENFCREPNLITWQQYGPCIMRFHVKRGPDDLWKGYLNLFLYALTKMVAGDYQLLCSDTPDFEWDEWKITANNQPQEYDAMDLLPVTTEGWYKFKVQEDKLNFIIRVQNQYFQYWNYACRCIFRSMEHPIPEEQPFFSFE